MLETGKMKAITATIQWQKYRTWWTQYTSSWR